MGKWVSDMKGVESWKREYQRHNPSTLASALTPLMRVMAPGRVKHHLELLQNMDDWHVQRKALRKDHGE